MGNTILGYTFSGLGLIALVSSFTQVKLYLAKYLPVLSGIGDIYLQIAGGVLVLLGVYFMMGKKGSKQASEVPIYQGKNIVGYRRQN
jgi:hypothetical protein